MSKLWKIFTAEYLDKLEECAMAVLKEAHDAKANPQSPDFIEAGTIGKLRHLAVRFLEVVGLLEQAPESRDIYLITDKGEKVLEEWKKELEKHKRNGV
jgi:predicted transcriptional regulator